MVPELTVYNYPVSSIQLHQGGIQSPYILTASITATWVEQKQQTVVPQQWAVRIRSFYARSLTLSVLSTTLNCSYLKWFEEGQNQDKRWKSVRTQVKNSSQLEGICLFTSNDDNQRTERWFLCFVKTKARKTV